MITLYGSMPMFGLPQPSPFVMKSEVHLKMAGLAYRGEPARPTDGPNGKIPFLRDGDAIVADSHFIRRHLEARYGLDLDAGLCTTERAQAWAFERMVEDHLYFAILRWRWLDDANFAKGPALFFAGLPAEMMDEARTRVAATLHGQGISRHGDDNLNALTARSLSTLSAFLGDKPYFMGERETGVDAAIFALLAGAQTPFFESPLQRQATGHANLAAYTGRMMARHFPDIAWGAQAA